MTRVTDCSFRSVFLEGKKGKKVGYPRSRGRENVWLQMAHFISLAQATELSI